MVSLQGLYWEYVFIIPRPPKGSKKWNPPNMNPLLHWGNKGISTGAPFFGSFRGSGIGVLRGILGLKTLNPMIGLSMGYTRVLDHSSNFLTSGTWLAHLRAIITTSEALKP